MLAALVGALLWPTFAVAAESGGSGGASPSDPVAADGPSGGASADGASRSGALAYGAPERQRPIARIFRVSPGRVREGAKVRLRVRIDERGIDRVAARVVAIDGAGRVGARFSLGRVRTNRAVTLRWPARHVPAVGTWTVRLHVKDPYGSTLARAARTTGKSRLTVRPRPRPENTRPEPPAEPTPPPAPPSTVTGVFPVAGAYTLGGTDGRFGAGRKGHIHEGQDIAAAEGVPVVAPVAGVVKFVDFQKGGAGHYVVLDADDGTSMFFAHLQDASIVVTPGQRVAPGQPLGRVGSTGSSTGPHLHFEIWQGGWRDRGGKPTDPLPQLQAWAR